jgi:hypothetical protein
MPDFQVTDEHRDTAQTLANVYAKMIQEWPEGGGRGEKFAAEAVHLAEDVPFGM